MIYKGLNGPHRAKMAKKPKTISVLAPPPYNRIILKINKLVTTYNEFVCFTNFIPVVVI